MFALWYWRDEPPNEWVIICISRHRHRLERIAHQLTARSPLKVKITSL